MVLRCPLVNSSYHLQCITFRLTLFRLFLAIHSVNVSVVLWPVYIVAGLALIWYSNVVEKVFPFDANYFYQMG